MKPESAELAEAIKLLEARLSAALHLRLTNRICLLEGEKNRLEFPALINARQDPPDR